MSFSGPDARSATPAARLPASALEGQAAMLIAIARRSRPPMKKFANEVRIEMGLRSLSRRAVYAWERGESRVPAAALLAAARVSNQSIEELLAKARQLDRIGLRPGQ